MNFITKKRQEKGLTKTKLAQLVGVSESTVSRWESGKIRSLKSTKLLLLSLALNLTLGELMELVSEKEEK